MQTLDNAYPLHSRTLRETFDCFLENFSPIAGILATLPANINDLKCPVPRCKSLHQVGYEIGKLCGNENRLQVSVGNATMGSVKEPLANRTFRPGVWYSLLRVDQYVKNLFVFLPPFFAGRLLEFQVLVVVAPSFIVLCLLASGIYVINDLRDIEEDRTHPIKCKRPLPSGAISPGKAKALAAGLFLAGFGLAAVESLRIQSWELFLLFCTYVFINVLYTYWLKRFAILDVAVIAVGFVIRIILGAVSSAVPFSNWIIMMTFLLALFLGFGKRRDDLILLDDEAVRIRKSAGGYSLAFLDAAMVMMGSIVVVAYIMYTVSPEVTARFGTHRLYLTTVFVVLGILRYLQTTLIDRNSGSPTQVLLRDRFLLVVVTGWIVSFLLIIYVK